MFYCEQTSVTRDKLGQSCVTTVFQGGKNIIVEQSTVMTSRDCPDRVASMFPIQYIVAILHNVKYNINQRFPTWGPRELQLHKQKF